MELYRRPGRLAPLCALRVRLGAGIACCACVAAQLAADGAWGPVEHHSHLSDAIVLLHQAGQRHAVFRLKLLVVSRGALHLRTLQGCRCCTSLLNPPGVAAHVIANWVGFKRHFSTGTTGRLIVVTCLIALAGSFFSLPGSGNEGIPPHILALKAVTKAPMTQVAALAGKPVEQVILDLAKAGINVSSPDANLQAVLQGDKGLEAKAMRAIFSPRS